jgi:DNA polymerase III delta prime subunit
MLTLEKKINKIIKLSPDAYLEMLVIVLGKSGYKTIDKVENYITAQSDGLLTPDKHCFLFIDEKLSGKVDYDIIADQIGKIGKADSFSSIFLVSSNLISKGFREQFIQFYKIHKLHFIDRDDIIQLIDKNFVDYWKHDDIELLDYERTFCESLQKESELKRLKIFNEKYQKIFDIFIEPRISHFYEDKETKVPLKKSVSIEFIINEKQSSILSGTPGTGKSTTLKKIGEYLILNNQEADIKNLPIFLSVTEIYESKFKILELVQKKLLNFFDATIEEILKSYKIILLVDSIDEFEEDNQKMICKELHDLSEKNNCKFILATRSNEKTMSIPEIQSLNSYQIERFNSDQIQQFVSRFFINQTSRAEKLLEALKENRILEKLPITPLTLSLISILFEENDLEIPATITDIYENFSSLLLGRAVVSSKIEFIDISFKERILSLYALELLKRKEHTPMTEREFIDFFKEYYASKTIPIKRENLEDALIYLINNTGILFLKDGKYVAFSHDSFMEFYAAVEIFKHQRNQETIYVDNFFDLNWQNSAIFYAGKSKDMPDFLKKINIKLGLASTFLEFFNGVSGSGYLLQALYQSDNVIRKETVQLALILNLQAHDVIMKLAADDSNLFKSYKMPILWLMNVMYFFESFNSITLKEPLIMAFNDLYKEYLDKPTETNIGYRAFKAAMTLGSVRINENKEIEQLIMNSPLLHDPILTLLSEFTFKIFTGTSYKELKKEVKMEYKKIAPKFSHLLSLPASRLRFSQFDQIRAQKRIKLITEGKTDAEIIEHAFITLTGEFPYWSIFPAGNESGGASEVKKVIDYTNGTIANDEILIGIYDHDDKGIGSFNGHSKQLFNDLFGGQAKKHVSSNVYALLLPIPGEMDYYLQADQKFNFFTIEHYFPESFLLTHSMLQNTPIDKVKSIKSSRKKEFSKAVRKETSPAFFSSFIQLFELIDNITGVKIDYEKLH